MGLSLAAILPVIYGLKEIAAEGAGIVPVLAIVLGVAFGLLGNFAGLQLPEPAMAFFTMMTAAVLPTALFGLGGALNEYRLAENWPQGLAMSV